MKKIRSTLLFLAVCITLLPTVVSAQSLNEAEYRSYLLALIAALEQQITTLQAQLEVTQTESDTSFSSFLLEDETEVVARYRINTTQDLSGLPSDTERKAFARFFDLTPNEFDGYFQELLVFDIASEYDAFVETIPPYQADTWRFGINVEVLSDDIENDLVSELLVHEISHVLSYDAIPGVAEPARVSCHRYFDTFGCPPKSSYLHAFVQLFWPEDMLDALMTRRGVNALWGEDRLGTDFVSKYAATSPAEDFSESFVEFVFSSRPTDRELKDKKVNFFYAYREMREWRQEIREQL